VWCYPNQVCAARDCLRICSAFKYALSGYTTFWSRAVDSENRGLFYMQFPISILLHFPAKQIVTYVGVMKQEQAPNR
jgi:hypothetical protein